MSEWPLDHIGIAVHSVEDSAHLWESLTGASRSPIEEVASQGVRVLFVGTIELIEPTREDSPIARYLERHGSGLHHIAWRVPEIAPELERLIALGHKPVDRVPRPGARGHRVAFLHPRDVGGVLVELVESP